MAAYYRQRQPLSKYVVHPHYADEQEAQIDHQVRIFKNSSQKIVFNLKCLKYFIFIM